MSVAIYVGVMTGGPEQDPAVVAAHRRDFFRINELLAEEGLPPHDEPETLPDFPYRGQLISYPYSWLHHLRRAVAFARRAPLEFRPLRPGESAAKDKRVQDELYTYISSHIICHSDSEGYFVPVDFEHPLIDSRETNDLPGGMLGSCQRVFRDLVKTAPLLEIPLSNNGELTDEAARVIATEADEAHPYWIERKVWFSHFEAFRYSLAYKCAVVYG